jgi:uncharacterized protein
MSGLTRAKSRRGQLPAEVRLGRSGVHGYGLFARDFIPQGWRIIEYLGRRITKAESARRETTRLARLGRGQDACVYIFELNRRYDIDGDVAWNQARRANHSCAPNCESLNFRGHIWLVAKRDIAPDEELTFDYGFAYAEWRNHPCRCGAAGCIGFIVNHGQRWRVRRILVHERNRKGRKAPDKAGFSSPSIPAR